MLAHGDRERPESGLSEHRHYPNAPIIEATISLGVVAPTDLTVADLDAIGKFVEGQYSKAGDEYFYAGQVRVPEPGDPPEHEDVHEHLGYGFSSGDGKRVFRARLDSFNFSVMQPYDSWEPFRNEARRLWNLFKEVSGVEEISRVAVRYINRIDIPATDVINLDDYLFLYPEVPDDWPSGSLTNSFFMQLQMWQADLDCMLIVNEAPARAPDDNIVSVRLDFDLFREQYENPWRANDDAEVWKYLERLRERKNEVFNASITNETRRLIE